MKIEFTCMWPFYAGHHVSIVPGAAKKVIPYRILQIFKQPFRIFFDETLQFYSLFIVTYNCQILFN